jgi:hypothetical protein
MGLKRHRLRMHRPCALHKHVFLLRWPANKTAFVLFDTCHWHCTRYL